MVTAIVCLVSAVVIQRIFVKETKTTDNDSSAQGIKWFGMAIFVWGLGALFNLIMTTIFEWQPTNKLLIYVGLLVSLLNSLFILLCLPSIEHDKPRGLVVQLVERFSTKQFVSLYFGVLFMIGFVFLATSFNNPEISNNFIWLIDIPISIIVAFALLAELNKAFSNRNMKFMYLPTFVLFVLIVIAVSHRIIPQDRAIQVIDQKFWGLVGSITSISFKFLFILLFSILLYSWKFLSEKEEKESVLESILLENQELKNTLQKLTIANDSHLDTIQSMKMELETLREASKIELSDRQKEVLGNLAYFGDSKSYPEIAEAMHISLDGFQTHIHQIKKLLNISGRKGKEQLIAFAKENDLLRFATPSLTNG